MVLTIQVAGLSGDLGIVEVGAEATVKELRVAIEASLGVPFHEQRLLRGVEELRDDATVAQSLAEVAAVSEEEEECFLRLQLVRRPAKQAQWLLQFAEEDDDKVANLLRRLPLSAQEDRVVVLAAVRRDGCALQHAYGELWGDRELVLAAVAQNGQALQHASPALRADRDVVLAAAATTRGAKCALQYATAELRADRAVVLAAVTHDGRSLQYASEELRSDREVVMAAVANDGYALAHAAAELQADREVVLAAVTHVGRSLQYASEELRSDREVVMAAVANDGYALTHASAELRVEGRWSPNQSH